MWSILTPIIAQYGVKFAQQLYTNMTQGTPPTDAQWATLNTLAEQNAKSQMLLALARNGVDPTSPQGVALLALTPAS